ncbi:CDGSH iron-sulfur domain-containing protein [Streptomyces sp. NPDC093801]|uniref:CDGSH iron-sulfur domain-containing protein n=1 Tax=Streptomyces sp. NPDC093801 TaxID=3155203 RepID=UPI00344B1A17
MPGTPEPDRTPALAGRAPRPRRVAVERGGPVLVEGPVEIVLDDGTVARSDRFVVAVCTCRRTRTHPWCDTSHRARKRSAPPPAQPGGPAGPEDGEDSEDGGDSEDRSER